MDRDERNRVRAERYRDLSEKSAEKARNAYERSSKMSEAIPFGQPVHGAADRRYREKIWNTMGQSVKHTEKSEYWAEKASAVENNTSFEGKALAILDRYDITEFANLGSNSETNKVLAVITGMARIKKHVTYHTARHTCATLLIHQGVPITTVQRLLGHTSVKTTEIYSEILSSTIVRDLKAVKRKRNNNVITQASSCNFYL